MFIVIRRIKEEKQREREAQERFYECSLEDRRGFSRGNRGRIARSMSDNSLRRKTRSASICAPGFSSMEQMLEAMPPSGARERDKVDREKDSGSGTPDGSTPTRRRRPATRSQSARVSGANKSIRRRAAAQGNHAIVHFFFFFSEMRLRDLFIMEILFDGRKMDVSSLANFLKRSKRNDEEDWMVCERLGNKLWDWSNIGFLIWCVYFFVVINLNYWNYFKKSELRRL